MANVDPVIKKLEDEIVELEQCQVALLKRKNRMEEELRRQKAKIADLELITHSESQKLSLWKKVALILAASWAVFLSFVGFERK
jgi:hypothetical protein